MGGLEAVAWQDFSAGALVAIVVMMVLTGWLVPRRVLTDMRTERDEWRELAKVREQQLTMALEAGEVATLAMRAMTEAVQGDKGDPR